MPALNTQAVKRIEIVLLRDAITEITAELIKLGVTGYTIIDSVKGSGEKGLRSGADLSNALQYQYLVIACDVRQVEAIAATIGPYIKRFGGICMISDAQRIMFQAD